jgi:glutamyl-tRNA synthetase
MKAGIFLRIDDMDRGRVGSGFIQDIFDTLRFLEIPWNEGPVDVLDFERSFSQVGRLGLYQQALQRLRDSGLVYACSCSRAQLVDGVYPGTCRDKGLSLDAEGVSWRVRTDERVLRVRELSGFVDASLPLEMHDFIVRKKDGFPAYQLCSLVDDLHFGVDMIVRGQDLWASTLAQHFLSYFLDAAAFREALFFHHPLLMDSGEKLSKSAGATSIQYLRGQGVSSAEVYERIGRQLGLAAVTNWEKLGAGVFGAGGYRGS